MEKWMEYVWANDDEGLAPLSLSLSLSSVSLTHFFPSLAFLSSFLPCLDASLGLSFSYITHQEVIMIAAK